MISMSQQKPTCDAQLNVFISFLATSASAWMLLPWRPLIQRH